MTVLWPQVLPRDRIVALAVGQLEVRIKGYGPCFHLQKNKPLEQSEPCAARGEPLPSKRQLMRLCLGTTGLR